MAKKRVKGEGVKYDEVKTSATFRLTPTALKILKQVAEKRGTSQAEVLEEVIRQLTLT
jgi:hypothetical protein